MYALKTPCLIAGVFLVFCTIRFLKPHLVYRRTNAYLYRKQQSSQNNIQAVHVVAVYCDQVDIKAISSRDIKGGMSFAAQTKSI